jgi:hypothetical protein
MSLVTLDLQPFHHAVASLELRATVLELALALKHIEARVAVVEALATTTTTTTTKPWVADPLRHDPAELFPPEIVAEILSHLPLAQVASCFTLNSHWSQLSHLPYLWHCLFQAHFASMIELQWLATPELSVTDTHSIALKTYQIAHQALYNSNLAEHTSRMRQLLLSFIDHSKALGPLMHAQAILVQDAVREQMRSMSILNMQDHAAKSEALAQTRRQVRSIGSQIVQYVLRIIRHATFNTSLTPWDAL